MGAPSKNQLFVMRQMCGYEKEHGSGDTWCGLRKLWHRSETRSKYASDNCKRGLGYKGLLGSKYDRIGTLVCSGEDAVAGVNAMIYNALQNPCVVLLRRYIAILGYGLSHYAGNVANIIECDVGLALVRASVRVCRCVHVMGTGVSLLGFFGVSPIGCTVNTVHSGVAIAPLRRRLCCNYGDYSRGGGCIVNTATGQQGRRLHRTNGRSISKRTTAPLLPTTATSTASQLINIQRQHQHRRHHQQQQRNIFHNTNNRNLKHEPRVTALHPLYPCARPPTTRDYESG